MIRLLTWAYSSDEDFVPQAIFKRPLKFFTPISERDYDDLDYFDAALFCLSNQFNFILKRYDGHPLFTVTLYLEPAKTEMQIIKDAINEVVLGFRLPNGAVSWRRGEDFEFGIVSERPDRLHEAEARLLVLKIAAAQKYHTATTSLIKKLVPEYRPLSSEDLKQSLKRKNERVWQQIVGNAKSHHRGESSIFSLGLAERTEKGLKVTRAGLDLLENLGFSVSYTPA